MASSSSSPPLPDHFRTLGLRTPTSMADVDEEALSRDVPKEYRRLAVKYHPDKNKSEEAVTMFNKVREAYETLTEPHLLHSYLESLFQTTSTNSGTSNYYYYSAAGAAPYYQYQQYQQQQQPSAATTAAAVANARRQQAASAAISHQQRVYAATQAKRATEAHQRRAQVEENYRAALFRTPQQLEDDMVAQWEIDSWEQVQDKEDSVLERLMAARQQHRRKRSHSSATATATATDSSSS